MRIHCKACHVKTGTVRKSAKDQSGARQGEGGSREEGSLHDRALGAKRARLRSLVEVS